MHTKTTALTLTLLLTAVLYSYKPTPVHAVIISSTSAATTASDSSETTTELKKRIEKVVEEKREQIKGVLQGIISDKKGFLGEVQRVTDDAITVKSSDKTTIIPITEAITLQRKDKAIKVDEVAVGNWAIVIGKETSTGDFQVEEVEISTDKLTPEPQVIVIGNIDAITTKDITVTTRNNNQKQAFTISKNSDFEDSNGSEAQARLFTKDTQALLVGVSTESGVELKTIRALAPLKR